MGGRYHITQECLSGHDDFASVAIGVLSRAVACAELLDSFEDDLSCLSSSAVGVAVADDVLLKSKPAPGVLGVLTADPKDAKAPEPSPNAEEALGDVTVLVFRGCMSLIALTRPGVDGSTPAKRLEEEKGLELLSFLLSRFSVL